MILKINDVDLTKYTTNISLSESIETLARSLTSSLLIDDSYNIHLGDKIELLNKGKSIYKGIIITLENNTKNYSLTSYDLAFYLNKSKQFNQFRNEDYKKAIEKICSNLGISVEVENLQGKIYQVFNDETASDQIKKILEENFIRNNKKHYIIVENNTLKIKELNDNNILNIDFNIYQGIKKDINFLINNIRKKESIEELKNSIIVITDDNENTRILEKAKDDASIKKYGLIMDIIPVNNEDYKKGSNIANSTLKAKNKPNIELDIELITDIDIRIGQTLDINTELATGKYIVKSNSINIKGGLFSSNIKLIKGSEWIWIIIRI